MRPMILFNQVNKWYGEYQALTDVSAEIKAVKWWWCAVLPDPANRR